MPTAKEIEAGAKAIAVVWSPHARWVNWSEDSRTHFIVQAKACLEAAEKARK